VPDRLTPADIGCWVLKSRSAPAELDPGWTVGASRTLTRCLRRSYRVELMAAGQPCLLWVSGRQQPGVRALGELTGAATSPDPAEGAAEAAVTVSLTLLEQPLERSALLADHVFAGAEVLRMPAGSNPSYLSAARLDVLLDLLTPEDLQRSGWLRLRAR
jgi:hypothetical protein